MNDLTAFASRLLKAGYTVLAMDLPAHGASAGQYSSIPQSARALREALGPLYAVIAHSMGAAILTEALYAGLAVQRAVLISAPLTMKVMHAALPQSPGWMPRAQK